MQASQSIINKIKVWEGLKLVAYLCPAGKWTIGYGHTGPDVHPGMKINTVQAEHLLANDILVAEGWVKRLVKVALTQGQFDALVSFVFNLGGGKFQTSTLLKMLNQKNYASVPGQLKLWVHGDHSDVLDGLVKRRAEEAVFWNHK